MKVIKPLLIIGSIGLLSACNQGNERLAEKAQIEGKSSAEAGIATENENLRKKSVEMETDLSQRHLFYQATKGTYEGTFKTEQGDFRIRITLVPSLFPYTASRTRQLDEVTSDLNNLYFNAQIVQWNPKNKLSAVGCRINQIRADLNHGTIAIASENCPNLYTFQIAASDHSDGDRLAPIDEQASTRLADLVRTGQLESISELHGTIQPSTNAATYEFAATRATR